MGLIVADTHDDWTTISAYDDRVTSGPIASGELYKIERTDIPRLSSRYVAEPESPVRSIDFDMMAGVLIVDSTAMAVCGLTTTIEVLNGEVSHKVIAFRPLVVTSTIEEAVNLMGEYAARLENPVTASPVLVSGEPTPGNQKACIDACNFARDVCISTAKIQLESAEAACYVAAVAALALCALLTGGVFMFVVCLVMAAGILDSCLIHANTAFIAAEANCNAAWIACMSSCGVTIYQD